MAATGQKQQLPEGLNASQIIKSFVIKVWVQKDTFYISRFTYDVKMDYADPKGQGSFRMDLNLDATIHDHNKPLTIELPEDAKSAQDITQQLSGQMTTTTTGGTGTAVAGESCRYNSDCQTGLKCVNYQCSQGNIADSCYSANDCQSGLQCFSLKCREYGSVGDACFSANDCKSGLGLKCVSYKCSEGKVGDTCYSANDCQTGLKCTSYKCAS